MTTARLGKTSLGGVENPDFTVRKSSQKPQAGQAETGLVALGPEDTDRAGVSAGSV